MRSTEFGRFTYLKLLNGRIYMSQAYTRKGREKTIGQLEKREEWGEGAGGCLGQKNQDTHATVPKCISAVQNIGYR
jgi:hypothetical protein